MKDQELLQLIKQGESETLEFKTSFNRAVIETIVAFSNTSGGKVLIGVSDNQKIVGISGTEETVQKWINEIKQNTTPSIIPDLISIDFDDKTIIQIEVNEFPIKPVSFRGRYFKRVRNSNHQMDVKEISNLHLQSLQSSWDAYEFSDTNVSDLDFTKVETFIKRVNDSGRFFLEGTPVEVLHKLSLIKNESPTNAAMIMFSKRDLHYNVHVGRFKTPSMIIADKMISGGAFEIVEETMQFILGQLKVAFHISGKTQRDEIFEYPLPALRELVLNAIVHRDYSSPVDVQIKIFDNSITIFNPGKLYGNLTIEDLKTDHYQSWARNKLIAEAFYLTKDIEKYGSGYIRVRKEILNYPTMVFNYKELGDGFWVELSYQNQKLTKDVPKNVPKDVPKDVPKEKRTQLILELVKNNPGITMKEISEKCNVSVKTTKRDIEELRSAGKLKREGGRKKGNWVAV